MYCRRKDFPPLRETVGNYNCYDDYGNSIMATACDGSPECSEFDGEECSCDNAPEFCGNITSGDVPCHYGTGNGEVYLGSVNTCDGVQTCNNLQDERGCASRFYCTEEPIPNIPLAKRCDLQDDCVNGADEANCLTQYYCNDGGNLKYISWQSVCDGRQDCRKGSDECLPGCIVSVFADEKAMITNKAVLALVWIFSIVAITGCSAVVVLTSKDLLCYAKGNQSSMSGHTKISKILILNLSISDFLVGAYTISICIKTLQFDGSYCLVDRPWRSSTTCSALGAMLIIGSEQSVFTMVLITIQRLRAIMNPMIRPKSRYVVTMIGMTWIISLIIGLVPMIPRLEDYFVTSIAFTDNKIFKSIHQDDKQNLTNWLNLLSTNKTSSDEYKGTDWKQLEGLIAEINPNISVTYTFGYYSSHSVCLPTFFPDPNNKLSCLHLHARGIHRLIPKGSER